MGVVSPTRDSWQAFGRPDKIVYYGREGSPWPAAYGRTVRVARRGFNGMVLVDDACGEVVDSMGGTAKFWAILLDDVEPGIADAAAAAAVDWDVYRACTTCGAQTGEPCRARSGRVEGGRPDGAAEVLTHAHAAREVRVRR